MRKREHILLGGAILGLALGASLASRGAAPGAEVSELKVTIREWNVPHKGRASARSGGRAGWRAVVHGTDGQQTGAA